MADKEWIKCKCGYYMPPDYDRCDACLLREYVDVLGYGHYDSSDHLGSQLMFDEDNVFSAIRKAEAKRRKK
jgi:hypothetical protein